MFHLIGIVVGKDDFPQRLIEELKKHCVKVIEALNDGPPTTYVALGAAIQMLKGFHRELEEFLCSTHPDTCKDPQCRVHGKKTVEPNEARTDAPKTSIIEHSPDCGNPDCPMHGERSKEAATN